MPALSCAHLLGIDESHLEALPEGQALHPQAAAAWRCLLRDARAEGFDLRIASSYRSFARQLLIWNRKARGQRPVHDDEGCVLDLHTLSSRQQLEAILRFSALPGASRHHWGSDLDVFDAAAVPADYELQLSPSEVAPEGVFGPVHEWLDERMASGRSHGFFRPYARDRGGVAPERWHLSYAPLSLACSGRVDASLLRRCWDEHAPDLCLRSSLERDLEGLVDRYVSVADGWAGASEAH